MCCAHNTNDNWKTSESINWHGDNKGVMWSHLMPRVIRAMQPTSLRPVATLDCPILAPIGNSSTISKVEPPGALSSWRYYELQLVKLPLACRESGQMSVMLVSIVEHWTLTWGPMLPSPLFTAPRLLVHRVPLGSGLGGIFARAGLGAEHPENMRTGAQKPATKICWIWTSGLFLLCNKVTKQQPSSATT